MNSQREGGLKYSYTLSLSSIDVGWMVNAKPCTLYAWERDPIPVAQKAGWAPGPICKSVENLVPTGVHSPDCPDRSE